MCLSYQVKPHSLLFCHEFEFDTFSSNQNPEMLQNPELLYLLNDLSVVDDDYPVCILDGWETMCDSDGCTTLWRLQTTVGVNLIYTFTIHFYTCP